MRMEKIKLSDVEVYGGVAAVDGFLGATQESDEDKSFGGAHIIEALIKGKDVFLEAQGKERTAIQGRLLQVLLTRI